MGRIDLNFETQRGCQWLLVRTNICDGWRLQKDGYGFFGKAHTEYQGDDDLKIQVWVNPSPRRLAPSATAFPVDIQKSGQRQTLLYCLQSGVLTMATTMDVVERHRLKHDTPVYTRT